MPLFSIKKNRLDPIAQTNFPNEKTFQSIVEGNLKTIFKCNLVASEFPTGRSHGGRIDTLALSEDNNPVIIEYKTAGSSELITQSLFYLSWIRDHEGDFKIAAQAKLGSKIKIDFTDVRVICIAPNYRKYDMHAAQAISDKIELWTYRKFNNSTIYLEPVLPDVGNQGPRVIIDGKQMGKNPIMVAAGKKAAMTRAAGEYQFEQHIEGRPQAIRDLAISVQEFIQGIDSAIKEIPKKYYVAYRLSQNIVCMEVQKSKVLLFLNVDPAKVAGPKGISRDVSDLGHYGSARLEIALKRVEDFEAAKRPIMKAYQLAGN